MRFLPLVSTCLLLVATALAVSDEVQFNRDIRPILSSKCYQCHGPDEHDRQAELRFDKATSDLTEREIIVPNDPEASELIGRITSDDPEVVMPPPEAKLELTDQEIELLKRWIEQGGELEGHWSFIPPKSTSIPTTTDTDSIQNEIDTFVQRRLTQEDLTLSPEADRRTLIRRATFDLWGLPPTRNAIHEFVNDDRPDAYERLLDRLLNSPRYAERMTLAWMDVARYGDTSVFHADGPRQMWPWRDWVLKAYANNMPFDQFTIEQLAGDLLEEPTTEQLVATGFNRNHGTTDEGGAIDEEYRVEYIVDRVKTTSMVWLGLTMECAQCHDHKYDPISQDDYYRFFAFFNQTPEKGMQTRNGNAEPRVMIASKSQESELEKLNKQLKTNETTLANAKPTDDELNTWIKARLEGTGAAPELGEWYRIGPFKGKDVNETFEKKFGPEKQKKIDVKKKFGKLEWSTKPEWKDGKVYDFGYAGDGDTTYLYRKITVSEPTELHASLGSDDTLTVWINNKEIFKEKSARGAAPDQAKITMSLNAGDNDLLIKVCNGSGQTGYYFKAGDTALPADIQTAVELAEDERTEEQTEAIAKHYKDRVWPKTKEFKDAVAAAKKSRDEYQKKIPTVMVMNDMKEPRMTYVLNRGSYDSPIKERVVEPTPPSFLPSIDEASGSRLGLAKWLTSPEQPLTARVTVNRYWTMLFGEGIVSTVADFGSQGAWPSHPDLLDYLARDFVDSGWNVKRMLRKIMTSRTYRQSSNITKKQLAKDPLNRYLARAPRIRLSAEAIRDNALAVAGLLVEKVGGPGVNPYQPPGLWNEVSLDGNVRFKQDHGEKLYRRTMYTYWKRSSPQPAMMTFDVPTREKCVIQRQRTNTPLQALVTLNDDQFVEASRCFAERLLEQEPSDDAKRLDTAFELATGRPADPRRHELLLDLLATETDRFKNNTEAAKELLTVGETKRNENLDAPQHAAWTIVASVILNLDETLNKE